MPRGLQPVYGQPQQLEIADDVLIERADFVERFEQIERDVGFELLVGLADGAEVVLDAEHFHVVSELVASVDRTSYSVRHGAVAVSTPVTSSGGTR